MGSADPEPDDLQTVELTAAPRHTSDELPASTSAGQSPTNGRTYTPSSSTTPGTRPRASPRNGLDAETASRAGSAAAARDVEGGFSGRGPDGPAGDSIDDDVGLLGGGAVRRQLLTAPKLPRWVGPAGTAGALLLLLIMSAVALRRSSAAYSASAAASLLSQALITDRLNRVSASPCGLALFGTFLRKLSLRLAISCIIDHDITAACLYAVSALSQAEVGLTPTAVDTFDPALLRRRSCRPLSQWPRQTWSAA